MASSEHTENENTEPDDTATLLDALNTTLEDESDTPQSPTHHFELLLAKARTVRPSRKVFCVPRCDVCGRETQVQFAPGSPLISDYQMGIFACRFCYSHFSSQLHTNAKDVDLFLPTRPLEVLPPRVLVQRTNGAFEQWKIEALAPGCLARAEGQVRLKVWSHDGELFKWVDIVSVVDWNPHTITFDRVYSMMQRVDEETSMMSPPIQLLWRAPLRGAVSLSFLAMLELKQRHPSHPSSLLRQLQSLPKEARTHISTFL